MKLPEATPGVAFIALEKRGVVQKPATPDSLNIEAWSSGYLSGALVVMACITVASMRKGVLLHKLFLAIWRCFWLFLPPPTYSWWLSVGGMLLDASWSLHNVIAWKKVTPFLSRRGSQLFLGTLILAQPFWIMEIYANFTYFNGDNELFLKTRPWEALCRDPWWLFADAVLLWKIKSQYEMSYKEIVDISPRFGIMILAVCLSVVFFILDIISATNTLDLGMPSGINPFWKVSSVFKCLVDCMILDDFKKAMDRLRAYKISHLGSFSQDCSVGDGDLVRRWEEVEADAQQDLGATGSGGVTWVDFQRPADVESSMRSPEHRRPSQLHRGMAWSPRFGGQHPEGGTLDEIHYLEEIVPTALDDDLVKRVEPSHAR
ncbi:hypothetical protein P171DRAFT_373333 [Karstenula rhodostoma CBS 690.94]|uniref:Uncharacterized protein n=1 Tax=Karstenula rhodostoma CBS 690.94 TaxID=1392251 RepID=A0A9P4P5B3_9PLEO|nr:hypothetical protein P171DRAFT_373333 [Karstenula rhodostoma CBS 690.94]